MSLSLDPKLPQLAGDEIAKNGEPAVSDKYWYRFQARFYEWVRELSDAIDNVTTNNAALRVPDVTIDAASNNFAASSGANAISLFNALLLPNTSTTTNGAAFVTALSYTGVGVLSKLVGCSQVAGGGSTAAGMSVQVTVDGNVIYSGAILGGASQLMALIGSAMNPDNGAVDRFEVHDDAVGIPFESSILVEIKSGTNGQGVSVGWKLAKKH